MKLVTAVRGSAVLRMFIGATLGLATRPLLKSMVPEGEPSGSFVLFPRTVGIRDAFFGLALLRASRTGRGSEEVRRLVQAWLANEVTDVVAAIAASRQLGVSGAVIAAVTPLPLIATDLWILRRLP